MEIIYPESISLNLESKNKKEILLELSEITVKNGLITSKDEMFKLYEKREKQFSIGLESGFAVSHGKGKLVIKSGILYIKLKTILSST